jgi:hypothetical protein
MDLYSPCEMIFVELPVEFLYLANWVPAITGH